MPPHGDPKAHPNAPGSPPGGISSFSRSIGPIISPPISTRPPTSRSSATIVALRASVPRRYSICTVSPGSSSRARPINFMPGPDASSSSLSAFTPPRAVPLKRVITSPTLRPAFSAGPLGVTPSIRAPTLSPVASARVSTITPMRPRLSLNVYTPNGPLRVSTRTRGRVRTRVRGDSCVTDAAGHSKQTASVAIVMLRIMYCSPSRALEPDVAGARGAGIHQLPHQADPFLPKFYELGVLYAPAPPPPPPTLPPPLRPVVLDCGNAVFQLRHQGRGVPAEHPAVDIVLLQGIFQRCRLLLRLTQFGVEPAALPTLRLYQQDSRERRGNGETAGPGAPGPPFARPFGPQHRLNCGPAVPRRSQRGQRLQLRHALVEAFELGLTRRAGGDVPARPHRRLTCPQRSQIFHCAMHHDCAP